MKAGPLLLLLCILIVLVIEGEAWRRRVRIRVRVRRVVPKPIRRVVRIRRVVPKPIRRVVRIRRVVPSPVRRIVRLRKLARAGTRLVRNTFRFRRIKSIGKKLVKPGRDFAKKVTGLVKKIGKTPLWLAMLMKGKQGPPPDWTAEVSTPEPLPTEVQPQPQPTSPTAPKGPECPTNGLRGDQSYFVANGDITLLKPTGAGPITTLQSGLKYSCINVSKELVNQDFGAIEKNITCIFQVAFHNGIQPSLVAAIASRDTRMGKDIVTQDGWDPKYLGYGIIKCKVRSSGLTGRGCFTHPWTSCDHINMMIEGVFMPRLQQIRVLKPTWSKHQQLQGAVAAMNYGVSGLQPWSSIDNGTTGNDYSNDIIARAQHLINCFEM